MLPIHPNMGSGIKDCTKVFNHKHKELESISFGIRDTVVRRKKYNTAYDFLTYATDRSEMHGIVHSLNLVHIA